MILYKYIYLIITNIISYTHNLKLLFVDSSSGNVLDENSQLQDIKHIFCDPITHSIERNGKIENITIQWNLKLLDRIQTHFMGDLFSSPIYEIDSIIYKHTQKTIDSINSEYNYKILFYISRLIRDRQIIPDFMGVV